tara:strand:- start:5834 stop:8689 length:2856 start_codon:yes stop_codon:yes gene_type:complete
VLAPDISLVTPALSASLDLKFNQAPVLLATGSAYFNGDDEFINCGDHANGQMTTNSFSVTYWAKFTDQAEYYVVAKIDGSGGNYEGYRFGFNGGKTRSSVKDVDENQSGDIDGVQTVNDGQWHHYGYTVNRTTDVFTGYVDGVVDREFNISAVDATIDADADLIIGGSYSGTDQNFIGNVANVGLWKGTVLTKKQVRGVMMSPTFAVTSASAGVAPSLYYPLDADLQDSAGNQNGTRAGATIVGAPPCLPRAFDNSTEFRHGHIFTGRAVNFNAMAFGESEDSVTTTVPFASGSICAWVRPDRKTGASIIFGMSGGGTRFGLVKNNTFLGVSHFSGSYRKKWSESIIEPGQWYHMCTTIISGSDGQVADSDVSMYIDGVKVTGSAGGTIGLTGANKYEIACRVQSTDNNFSGSISHIKIFDEPLTQTQAQELARNPELIIPTGVKKTSLRSFFPMCEFSNSASLHDASIFDYGKDQVPMHYRVDGSNASASFPDPVFQQPWPCPQMGFQKISQNMIAGDGNDKYDIASGSNINALFSDGGTIAFWATTNHTNADARLADSTGGGNGYKIFLDNASSEKMAVRFAHTFAGGDATWNTGVFTNNGIPFHYVVTYDGSDAANLPTVYVNGASASLLTLPNPSGDIGVDNASKKIGAAGTSAGWSGILPSCMMWNSILTAKEVNAIYNSGSQDFNLKQDLIEYDSSADLVGWWVPDNNIIVTDKSDKTNTGGDGGTNHGTLTSAPNNMGQFIHDVPNAEGRFAPLTLDLYGNNIFNLDGRGYIKFNGSGSLNPISASAGPSGFSVSAWVRNTGAGQGKSNTIFRTGAGNNRWYLNLRDDAGDVFQGNIGDGSRNRDVNKSGANNTDVWNHVCMVVDYDEGDALLYVNAVSASNDISALDASNPSTGPLFIGIDENLTDNAFSGSIAFPKIYSRRLKEAEVLQLYQSGYRVISKLS